MGPKCYVQGCKSGYNNDEKPHFFRPKDINTVKTWQMSIGYQELKLDMTHYVCHKHFEDAHIIKHKVQGKNGPKTLCELFRWKLVDGAIPKFLHGNSAKQCQPSMNSLPKPTVPGVPTFSEIKRSDQHKQRPTVPDNAMKHSVNFPEQIVLPSSWILQHGVLVMPKLPEKNVAPVRIASQSLQTLWPASGVTNHRVLNREEVILPPSWFWQEGFLKKEQLICSKFKWLDENNFEYPKSTIVIEDTRTLRYFVRGRQIFHEKLKPQFSTVNELNVFLKLYDDIPECVGYTNQKSLETALPLNVENRAKNCLLLASESSDSCTECLASMTAPFHHGLSKDVCNNEPNGLELLATQAVMDSRHVEVNDMEDISNGTQKTYNNRDRSRVNAETPILHIGGINKNLCETKECRPCVNDACNLAATVVEIPLDIESNNIRMEPAIENFVAQNYNIGTTLVNAQEDFTRGSDDHPIELYVIKNGCSTTLNIDTDTENEEDYQNDLALAKLYLQNEARKKIVLRQKFCRYSRMLTKNKAIGRSILKATKKFEQTGWETAKGNQSLNGKKPGTKAHCKQCGKVVLASRMKFHIKVHSGVKSHLCELCGRSFVFRSSLNSHIRLNHRETERPKPSFMCSVCGLTVCSNNSLKIHGRIHRDERPFDCKYCDKKFREKGTLVRHIRTHTGEKPYACSICGTSFGARDTYVSHYRAKHQNQQLDNSAGALRGRRKHPKTGYRCEYCGKEFCQGRILAYEKHLTTHTGVPASIPCTQPGCDFTYSDMTQLKEHTLAQHPEKAFTCDVCNKIFLSKQILTDHRSMHDPTRGFQCSFCPVKLTVKASLIAHEKLHTRETPHECSFCEMRFHSTYLLQIHIRTHQPSQLKRKRYRKPVEQ